MAETPARIVFMGTPDFAAAILERVFRWPNGEVVGVYTQPDRPSGRGNKIVFSPVKALALEQCVPVFQPQSFRDEGAVAQLAELAPDFLLVAAYGLILPQAVLDVPKFPPLNVHGSLLPKYRGAAPIQRAIMENWNPDAISGVSIMQMEASFDSGPVFATVATSLAGHTGGSLHDKLAVIGGEALCTVMDDLCAGRAKSVPQEHDKATYAAKLRKEDGQILWDRPRAAVDAHIRGVTPWPGAQVVFSFLGREEPIMAKILPGRINKEIAGNANAGTLSLAPNGMLLVACNDGWYELGNVKPQGRKEMASADFVRGLRLPQTTGAVGHAQ